MKKIMRLLAFIFEQPSYHFERSVCCIERCKPVCKISRISKISKISEPYHFYQIGYKIQHQLSNLSDSWTMGPDITSSNQFVELKAVSL